MKAGPEWPMDAVRHFLRALAWQASTARLENELAEERTLSNTLRGIHTSLSRDAEELKNALESNRAGIDESRLRAMEESLRNEVDARFEALQRGGHGDAEVRAHLARLDRKIVDLNRGMQALNARIDGILASRTWKALTAAGGVLLRFSGRKS
jgi:chromosome segregation ATPase